MFYCTVLNFTSKFILSMKLSQKKGHSILRLHSLFHRLKRGSKMQEKVNNFLCLAVHHLAHSSFKPLIHRKVMYFSLKSLSDFCLLSVHLLAQSPSLVGPAGRSTLSDDFSSGSVPASARHGASPSAPATAQMTGVEVPYHDAAKKEERKTPKWICYAFPCFLSLLFMFFVFMCFELQILTSRFCL